MLALKIILLITQDRPTSASRDDFITIKAKDNRPHKESSPSCSSNIVEGPRRCPLRPSLQAPAQLWQNTDSPATQQLEESTGNHPGQTTATEAVPRRQGGEVHGKSTAPTEGSSRPVVGRPQRRGGPTDPHPKPSKSLQERRTQTQDRTRQPRLSSSYASTWSDTRRRPRAPQAPSSSELRPRPSRQYSDSLLRKKPRSSPAGLAPGRAFGSLSGTQR